MNIGLIGSGGREHALCQKIFESNFSNKIVCFPGNAGTSQIAKNIDIDILNFKELLKEIRFHNIELVIVGPEEPLVKGLVDFLRKNKVKVFGPSKYASKLEGSKAFMKNFCKLNKIPTANYQVCHNNKQVKSFIKKNNLPLVVKADGLAAGKGVTICYTEDQILKISEEIFKGKFRSSKKVVLEEFLTGEEVSYFVIVDNKNFKFFGTAQDHKRVREKDRGKNTGGMGAYSPAPIVNKKLEKKILNKIVKPTLNYLKKIKNPYTGFLYVGLMIKKNEPYLIEFNVRMGDPECQVILPRLKTDFVKIIKNATNNKLKNTKIEWKKKKCMTIVMCSKGYPGKYLKNRLVKNLDRLKLKKIDYLFHAGTKIDNSKIYSIGGRVLNFTSIGNDFLVIRNRILKLMNKLRWKSGFYRKDIGWKIINKNENN